jgi:hypothetical protein
LGQACAAHALVGDEQDALGAELGNELPQSFSLRPASKEHVRPCVWNVKGFHF